MQYQAFINGSYVSESPIADNERTMNWYPEVMESPGAKSRAALYPTPGFTPWVTVADAGARALWSTGGRTFAVVGGTFYEILANQTALVRGTVVQDQYPATISYNGLSGNQLFVTSGGNGYNYDLIGNSLSLVLTGEATSGGMLDGYFLAFNIKASKVRWSNLLDGTTWDNASYFQRSIYADPWQAMIVRNREIILLGEQTGEAWYDQGTLPNIFAPIPGAVWNEGVAAPFACGVSGDTVVWLTRSKRGVGQVAAMNAFVPQMISTKAVEWAMARYLRNNTFGDFEMLTYSQDGHVFFCLSSAQSGATWVFDVSTNLWHERGTWVSSSGDFGVWRPRVYAYAFGTHLVGRRDDGVISQMDVTIGTDGDDVIRRVRRAPSIFTEHRQLQIRRIEVYLETGLGLVMGQGSDPQVLWRTSDDGGKTWGNQRSGSAGAIGAYQTRVIWTRMGTSRDRVNEMVCTDPIPWRIVDAYVNNDTRAS